MARGNGRNGKAFDGLIDAFYDTAIAVTEDCAWCTVLPRVCGAFEASAGSFMVHDFSAREGALRHDYNIRPEFRDAYNEGLSAMNPWMDSLAFYEEGAVVFGEDIVPHGDMVQTEFYSVYLEPQDLLHRLCGVITRDGQDAHLISLLRPPAAPAFTRKDKAALADLLPHLKRSIKVRDRVVRDRLARESLAEFMDLLPVAFLLVGHKGRVELQNRVAKEIIAQEDGLFVGAGGYLATASAKNTADLRQLITETVEAAPLESAGDECALSGEHFIISRGPDRLPLICVMYPVNGSRPDDEQNSEPAVAVLIKDPQAERFDGLPDFASAYDLTNAEARLIRLLTAGQGLFEAAAELGITKNTARTHMRNIYSKVGTHRQADLIRLFAQFSMF
ncbi:MAG: helix-turn-helix transcriptional regulator [Rhodospirillales bacterium]|nr:helix-turn-helix transcriptional regulator [Rhodospirillales bacterium]